MKYTYLGHAGFYVENGSFKLLIDPWHVNHLAYFNSWQVYPSNLMLPWVKFLKEATHVYISHIHEDHFDRRLLSKLVELNPKAIALIPKFKNKQLLNAVECYFDTVVEIEPSEQSAGCLTHFVQMEVLVSETLDRKKEDSTLILSCDKETFVHLNDCDLLDQQKQYIVDKYKSIDIVAGQFSGASWYPMCYQMDYDKKQELSLEHRQKYIKAFESNPLKAKKLIPCAGPVLFSHPECWQYSASSDWSMFPNAWRAEWTADNIYRVYPGTEFTVESLTDNPIIPIEEEFDYGYVRDVPDFEAAKQKMKKKFSDVFPVPEFFRKNVKQRLLIEVPAKDYRLDVDFRNNYIGEFSIEDTGDLSGTYYKMTMSEDMFCEVADSNCTDWENVLLSMRCKLFRNPIDMYDPLLLSLLRNLDKELLEKVAKDLEEYKPEDEMIEKDGFKFQRYCPHMKYDLHKFGQVDKENCTLTCSAHCWKWDLKTGKGVNVTTSIKVDNDKTI